MTDGLARCLESLSIRQVEIYRRMRAAIAESIARYARYAQEQRERSGDQYPYEWRCYSAAKMAEMAQREWAFIAEIDAILELRTTRYARRGYAHGNL